MRKKIGRYLAYGYLKLLEKTVQIEWEKPENYKGNNVVGFWHEDSLAMNLVLKSLTRDAAVSVLVTPDDQGENIRYLLEQYGGDAVKIGFGFCNAGTLKEILESLKDRRRSVAIAMDGPFGPRHIPKKLTYFLSEKSKTELVGVTVRYSREISLSGQWDHCHIPLPFSKITVRFDNYGVAACQCPPRIRLYQDERQYSIMELASGMVRQRQMM
ncbi:hypothetical protein [Sporofaciens musculi]|uniref:hypothetical protein n=1 Tax=Sporofaciens musculi TaxID=2681861 RepID=UPI00256FF0F5|nr:hypothetical protein [Sporofaciens musculi]